MECPVMNEEFSYYVNGKEVIQLCNAGSIYEDGRLVGAYSIQRDMTRFKKYGGKKYCAATGHQ